MTAEPNSDSELLYSIADLAAFGPPRLTAVALPPYAYIPGRGEHPLRSPTGYLRHELEAEPRPALVPTATAPEDWLVGIDFYNLGYFWEAHERWEGLWHQLGRAGFEADLLKALIQTAAAQIKCLIGNWRGLELLADKSGLSMMALAQVRESCWGLRIGAYLAGRDSWFANCGPGCEASVRDFPFLILDASSS